MERNRERVLDLFKRDSIILWALTTYPRRRKEFPQLFRQPEYAHLRVIRFRAPRETKDWVTTALSGK